MHVRGIVTLALVGLVVVALVRWFASSHDARDASKGALEFDARNASAGDVRSQSIEAPDDSTEKTATTGFSSDAQIVAAHVASPATPRTFRLAVFDDEAPAEVFGARVFAFPGGGDLQFVGPKPRDSHVLELVVPDVPFLVRALAECCETKDEGPFDPATVPGTIESRLTPSPGFEGVVFAGGAPLDGAEVSALSASLPWYDRIPPERVELRDPDAETAWAAAVDATWREPPSKWSTQSGRGGRFGLRVRDRGRFALRVAREGYATLETGSWKLDGKKRFEDLEFVLTRGGAIAGVVLDADRRPVFATDMLVTNGIAQVARVTTDGSGRFRRDTVAAGTWWIGAAREGVSSRSTALPWSVEVVDGATSEIEIVLGRAAAIDVELSPLLGYYGAWTMHADCTSIAPKEGAPGVEVRPSAEPVAAGGETHALVADPDHKFGLRARLALPDSSRCTLRASTWNEETVSVDVGAIVVAPIDVTTSTGSWTFTPAFGALEVELLHATTAGAKIEVLWTGTKGEVFSASVLADPLGNTMFPAVPVGACSVRVDAPSARTTQTIIEKGKTARVRL